MHETQERAGTNTGRYEDAVTIPVDRLPQIDGPVKMATRGLKLWYGEKQALSGINIDIPQNQVIALIGPSGCGKTTFLKCLNRMNGHGLTKSNRPKDNCLTFI